MIRYRSVSGPYQCEGVSDIDDSPVLVANLKKKITGEMVKSKKTRKTLEHTKKCQETDTPGLLPL